MVNRAGLDRQYVATTRAMLRQLASIRDSFGDNSAARRLSLIRKLGRRQILTAADLILFHDLLCFVRAYSDNSALLNLSERELRGFGKRVADYRRLTRDRKAVKLEDSGIDGSSTIYQFNYDMTRHLLGKYPGRLKIDWENSAGDLWAKISDLLGLMIAWEENDPLDNDDDFDVEEFFAATGGKRDEVKTLVNLFAGSGLPEKVLRDYWESLGLLLDWNLTNSPASRSRQRVETRERFYQTEPLRRRTADLRREIEGRPSPLRHVSTREGQQLLDTINEALGIRNRELFPLTFGNPGEVYTVDVGRGVRFVLYGSLPEARLPLESNFGALLVRNGMPVGYGVAALAFDRAEIAINVFPTFRGGESPYFFEQFFRTFYHHFGSRVFVVRAKQMGYGEEEALLSGAFWFYYKLGFRAVNRDIRKLADKENEKIKAKPNYRVPTSTMKRLSKTDVFFTIDPSAMSEYKEISIINLGYRVTKLFGDRYEGNRMTGVADATAQLARMLSISSGVLNRWSDAERLMLTRFAPLFVQIPDLPRWPSDARRALVDVIRAKGAPCEREYVMKMNQHAQLKRALEKLAR